MQNKQLMTKTRFELKDNLNIQRQIISSLVSKEWQSYSKYNQMGTYDSMVIQLEWPNFPKIPCTFNQLLCADNMAWDT